jgi:protein-S-isoprenylcysteine O-methyltransferase Ste14
MRVARSELYAGRTLLIALVAITILPFLSIFTTALHPSGAVPSGLSWPTEPQWGNFVEAFNVANMSALLTSSVSIVLAVVPISLAISTMAGFAIGLLRIPGARYLLLLFIFGLTLPFEGIITPLYFLARQMGILNSRLAIALPLIGLFMPFAVYWMRAIVASVGLALRAAAAGHVRKNAELTTTGPYAHVRNPLYLGSIIIAIGFGVAARSLWVAALMAAVFVALYLPVIHSEERYLRGRFPEFEDYARRVPRLFPRFTPATPGGAFSRDLYLKHREYNALLGAATMLAALAAKILWYAG